MTKTSLGRKVGAFVTAAVLAFVTACGSTTASTSTSGTAEAAVFAAPAATHADANDGDYSTDGATTLTLADGATAVSGTGASVSGDVVTIAAPGTYIFSGKLTDGQVVVNSPDEGKVRLVLAGVDITSASSSPVVVSEADEAVVILADGTSNALSDSAASGADDDGTDTPTATLFSMADLTIAGTGELAVTGESNDGIGSKDGLVVLSGTVDVTAKDDGIRGKDYLVIEGGTVTVEAGGDGLKSDNDSADEPGWIQLDNGTVTVSAGSDGADAVGAINVADGSLTVSKSTEGLEAATITIAGGTVDVTASDDGLNATSGTTSGGGEQAQPGVLLTISGGTTHVTAGGDGLDSNGSAAITGGTTIVDGPTASANGALDVNGAFPISGGTLIAVSGAGMAAVPSTDSAQGWVAATLTTAVQVGQQVAIVDSAGTVLGRYVVPKTTSLIVFSANGITAGQSYDIYAGAAGTVTSYSTGGSTDGLTKVAAATAGEFTSRQGGPGGGGRGGR
ncbi:carbohydrate-binding domain-containing protein [Actinokineospora diospyrosa]|uniref:Carbohydrate-binding domain-containing protein n=1 Tax=Actinokineospora diospyrosa TaxID=103728 RepID=A0ABT1IBI1_9PSEU|nr:carbohydrate-binding domain-containing protein [Actinokineospora diospyrosa]MCP2269994.1 protein of unknown function (DUF4353) [Actinokineospora diospyrosa]